MRISPCMWTRTPGAGAFVQIVDVLGHQQEIALPARFERGQGTVRGIWLDVVRQQVAPALIVEFVDEGRIAGEGLGRGHVLDAVTRPDAVGVAEGRQPGFLGDAGAGEDDDGGRAHAVNAQPFKPASQDSRQDFAWGASSPANLAASARSRGTETRGVDVISRVWPTYQRSSPRAVTSRWNCSAKPARFHGEGLVGRARRRGEVGRARRQIESVAVPMQHARAGFDLGERGFAARPRSRRSPPSRSP